MNKIKINGQLKMSNKKDYLTRKKHIEKVLKGYRKYFNDCRINNITKDIEILRKYDLAQQELFEIIDDYYFGDCRKAFKELWKNIDLIELYFFGTAVFTLCYIIYYLIK